jgi:hypothetical protein
LSYTRIWAQKSGGILVPDGGGGRTRTYEG